MKFETFEDFLHSQVVLQLNKPVHGYWDGGAKSRFVFTPSIERTAGPKAIRWGSWEANLWIVIEYKNPRQHRAAIQRKLRGEPRRTITFEPRAL